MGSTSSGREDIANIIGDDVRVWAAGVELVMEELSGGDLLPGRIFLCGGGSRLPEIREALAAETFWKRMPFARPPEVTVLAPDQIETVVDATDLLVDQQDVTPLGLAYQAIELQTIADPLDVALRAGPPRDEGLTWTSAILYLDIDDEITTAATRVRAAETSRIAMVLPNGSRVATSRINFRLLARDATLNGKRLSIVASDAATRALAASAGLPIFASVSEYESSVQEGGGAAAPAVEPSPEPVTEDRDHTGHAAAAAATAVGASKASPRGSGGRKPRGDRIGASTDATAGPVAHVGLAAAGATVAAAGASRAGAAALPSDVPGSSPRDATVTASHRAPAAVPAARVVADTPSEPIRRAPGSGRGRRVRGSQRVCAEHRSSPERPSSHWHSSSVGWVRSCSCRRRPP